jgi:putative transposase
VGTGKPKQLELDLRTWGGKRRRAGRKPKGPRSLVSHRPRAALRPNWPVHVTLRVLEHVWNLRAPRCFDVVSRCLEAAKDRFGCRIVEFSVQGNHIHLLVEAVDKLALRRGMQGLLIRVARRLNRLMRRRGPVFADHYHSRALRTPTEVARAREYVLGNFAHHARQRGRQIDATGPDPCSSAAAGPRLVAEPRTWLMTVGWMRASG